MKQATKLAVIPFENRNGFTSFRVIGWLHGERVRKNFKTREEASAEKAALEIQSLQATHGMRSVPTTLSIEQVRDAEVAYRRLAENSRPLSFYLDFALANYREPEKQKPLADAIAEYVAAKEREFEQDQISEPQFDRIGWELKRLAVYFKRKTVAEITASALVTFLEIGQPGMKTYNNRRGILSTFFKFSFQRCWIAENPIPKVPHFRIRRRRGVAQTLSVVQARAIMEHFEKFEEGRWVPYFALCLFAGIRPCVPYGEISKLKPEAVNLETGIIHISAEVSKVREPRKVTIQPNLAAWLRAYLRLSALNKVMLTARKWPFVLASRLKSDVTIGIDVKGTTAGFTGVCQHSQKVWTQTTPTKRKERLSYSKCKEMMILGITKVAKNAGTIPEQIVVQRDGRMFETEILAPDDSHGYRLTTTALP